MFATRVLLPAVVLLLAAQVASASDEACLKAVRSHASFKAVLSDDPAGRPQFETIRRSGGDMVEVTRYVAGRPRVVRTALYGLFPKEQVLRGEGGLVRLGFSQSLNPRSLMPLKSGTAATYRMIAARNDVFAPQFTEVKFSVGGAREVALGKCKFPVFDLTIESRTAATGMSATERQVYAPDIAYPIETTIELVRQAEVKTYVTKLRAIEDWPNEAPTAEDGAALR